MNTPEMGTSALTKIHIGLDPYLTSAYMVFHAESLAGIELHYAIQSVRGFENSGHHFPAAESALPTVDEPPADVPSSPRYYYFCVAAHVASLLTAASLQTIPL